jgi:hypothetical protein
MAGVSEGLVEGEALAGRETIQGDGEVVNAGPCHLLTPSARPLVLGSPRVETFADPTAGFTPRYCDRYQFTESVIRRGDHAPEVARLASPGSAHI